MTRVTFSPGQNNFQAKFKDATENVTLKNQVSAGSRLDSLSDVNTQSQPDNSILVYDSATDTFVQQALSTIAAANTSVASVSISGDIVTFTRQDGSTFTLNLSDVSANNIAVSAVQTNQNFKVPFLTATVDASSDYRMQMEAGSSQFVYNPSTNRLSIGTLGATAVVTSTFQMDNQQISQIQRSVESWPASPEDYQLPTALAVENEFTANSAFQSFVANTNPRIAVFNSSGEVAAHLLPAANVTYDIGSSARSFRDLYLSGDTLHLAESKITSLDDGSIQVKDVNDNLLPIRTKEIEIGDGAGGADKIILRKVNNKVSFINKDINGTERGTQTAVSNSFLTSTFLKKDGDTASDIVVNGLTVTNLVLTSVLGTNQGGTGLNSVTNNGVLVGKSSSALNYISGSSGEVFQVASNGTPTFSDVDGGTF